MSKTAVEMKERVETKEEIEKWVSENGFKEVPESIIRAFTLKRLKQCPPSIKVNCDVWDFKRINYMINTLDDITASVMYGLGEQTLSFATTCRGRTTSLTEIKTAALFNLLLEVVDSSENRKVWVQLLMFNSATLGSKVLKLVTVAMVSPTNRVEDVTFERDPVSLNIHKFIGDLIKAEARANEKTEDIKKEVGTMLTQFKMPKVIVPLVQDYVETVEEFIPYPREFPQGDSSNVSKYRIKPM